MFSGTDGKTAAAAAAAVTATAGIGCVCVRASKLVIAQQRVLRPSVDACWLC